LRGRLFASAAEKIFCFSSLAMDFMASSAATTAAAAEDMSHVPQPRRRGEWEMKNSPQEKRKAICNLHFMTGKIAGAKKKKGGTHTVKHCLIREDSSDDEDGLPLGPLKW
jgi:hypothetical protein